MTGLERLEAVCEEAWIDYNAIQRALPACEHVTVWQAEVEAARKKHRAAIREYDRALTALEAAESEPEPEPTPAAEPGQSSQPTLFDAEAAA